MADQIKDVHTRHCCARHGCKYMKPECTVTTGKAPQEHPCEFCGYESERKQLLDKAGALTLIEAARSMLKAANEQLGNPAIAEVAERLKQIREEGVPELDDFINFGSH